MGRRGRRKERSGATNPRFQNSKCPFGFRLQVINHLRDHRDIKSTLRRFFPGYEAKRLETKRKSIYKWEKNRDKIEKACDSGRQHLHRARDAGVGTILSRFAEAEILLSLIHIFGTILSRFAEAELVQWIHCLRSDGVPISSRMLQLRAQDIATKHSVEHLFVGSWSWQQSFLARHQLAFRARTSQGQVTPQDADGIAARFRLEVLTKMKQLDIHKLSNADQTAVFFEYLPKKTIDQVGSKTMWIRCAGREKERVTCMLLGDSTGAKYDPIVVLKSKPSTIAAAAEVNKRDRHGFGKLVWQEISRLQQEADMQIYGNAKGWWDAELSVRFIDVHFGTRTAKSSPPVLLRWDDFSGHWTNEVLAAAMARNVHLLRVPPHCTGVCQPADISWNMPLKSRLRAAWVSYMQAQLRLPTLRPSVLAPKREDVIKWIDGAWKSLSMNVIAGGFRLYAKPS
ncbi:TPA: hypothetical protein N0F65_009340 [Lagenidium giganteum]|uniref:HTH CENPB-type domain-containing protein n=1 Tax=Lagenidium giganteum TaxID=4803 RepID=A0AAV2YF71_9STRA|nr:TPA: hypothetical protein N0F65_009340 [Lagenidium giganteum]